MLPDDDNDLLAWAKGLKPPKVPSKPTKDDKDSVASVVDNELSALGYPPTARLSILGDIGRENNWDRNTIFKGHTDPKNKKFNRGLFSYQGDRQTDLHGFMKGDFTPSDDNLRKMVRFVDYDLKKRFPTVHQKLRNPSNTYDASEALRQAIKYVPDAPYNTYDPQYRVKNNRIWAQRAEQLGLGKDLDLDSIWAEIDPLLQDTTTATQDVNPDDVWSQIDSEHAIGRVQPTKELDVTIQGQIQAANDPNVKTRFGVLTTKPEQATLFANQPNFKPFEMKGIGTLWLNTAKIFANKKLKLKNEKDLQQYLKNPKALTTLIGVAEDVGNETRGTAVRAKDPKTGIELATGVVTNPVSAVEQAQNYKDQFPNAEIEVTDTDVVTDERKRMAAQVLDDPRQLGGEFAEVPTELKDREALQPVDTTAIDAMMRAPQRGQVQTPVVKVPTQRAQRPTKGKPTQRITQPERRRDSSLSGITSVPIENIPTENIDNFLSRQALTDAARRQGLGGDAVDAFLASRGGNILQTGTQPYTAEEIASYKDRGVKKIEVSFDKALEDDFRRFATDYTEAKTKDANEQLARQELRANIDEKNRGTNKQLSFTDPLTWKMAWDELWKGNWSGTITEEDRQSAIDNAVAEQVKNAGSAGERLRLDEEYKNLSNFDKGVAHVGDIYNTIQRAPASFAKTAAWIEDTTGYLREKGIILPWVTTTDIAQGFDWLASKTLGLQPSDIKQGALPTLFADAVEKMYPDDKRTANTMMGKIARGTGSAVPFLLGAMATGGGSVATGLLGAGMQVGEMYDTAQKEGLSREKQLLSGVIGAPIGFSEAWGLKWAKLGELINKGSKGVFLKSFTEWLKSTGKDATEEALQEFLQSTSSKLTITALKNNGVTLKDVTNAIGDSIEDATVGGIVGALFGGGVPLAVKASGKVSEPVTKARTDALLKTEPEASVEPVTEPVQQETPKTVVKPKVEKTVELKAEPTIEPKDEPRKVAPERKSVFDEVFGEEVVEKPKKKIKPTVTTEVTEEPVEKVVDKSTESPSIVYNKGGNEGEVLATKGDTLTVQWSKPDGTLIGDPVEIARDKVFTEKPSTKANVSPKAKNVNIKQPSVDSVNISDLPDGTKVTYTKADGTVVNGTMATDKFGRVVSIGDTTRSVKLPWKVVDAPMMMAVGSKQTDTPEFKKYFGKSKVVDEKGEPLVVYHGTNAFEDFDEFDVGEPNAGERRDIGVGYFFARSKTEAEEFTKESDGFFGKKDKYYRNARLVPVYLSINTPKIFNTQAEYFEAVDDASYHKDGQGVGLYNDLTEDGFDGIIIKDSQFENGEGGPWYIAFEPTQIKSAIGNKGTFDPNDPNILHKRPVEGSPEFNKATELANLPKRGETFLKGVESTAMDGFIDLSPEAVEMGRVIDKAVGRSEGIRYGTTYTKAEAIDHIEGAKDLRQVLKDKGMSTKAIDKYIADFEKVAKANQGIVPVGIEASRKHETLHGADLKSRIIKGETAKDLVVDGEIKKLKYPKLLQTFKQEYAKFVGRSVESISDTEAMAEAISYLGDGEGQRFGLTEVQAAKVLADIGIARFNSLVEAYDGDVEKAIENMSHFNIEGGEKIYEAIKSTDNGKGVRPSTESGQKREGKSETAGSKDVGNAEKAGQGKADTGKEESDGLKIRQYSESLRDAGFVDSPLVPYIPGTDAQKAEETNRIIETSDPMMHDAEKMFYAKGTDPKLKGVLGTALIDHLGSIGEIQRMLKVATDTVEYIGTAAQVLQAAKLVAKYDFASGLMMAQKAANKAGRNLTEQEVKNIKVKLEKIAVTTENQATLEYVVEELKTAIKAKDIEIANRDKALAEANTYREATDAELAKLKKQLAHKKPQTTREKLKESHAAREAAIRAQFRDTMMMAVGGEPKFDLKQNLIDEATLDIFDGKTPEQMVRHLQELTNNTLSDAEIADIHLKAWDATRYKTKPTTLDELTAEDKETRLALRERAKARREHIRAINDLKGVQKQSNYEIEVIEYGRANGYTDGEIASALYIPKVKGENAVEQWKKKIEGEFGEVNFHRAWHLRRVANANIKANQLEARHEREQYQGDLKAFENHLSRGRTASAVAKSEFTSYAQKVGRGWVKKTAHAVIETVAATKGLSTWGEISYVLRQGFVPLITDTRNAAKGDWQGVGHGLQGDNELFKAIASGVDKAKLDEIQTKIQKSKLFGKLMIDIPFRTLLENGAGMDTIAQYLSDHSVSMFIDRIRQHPSFGDAQRHGIRFTQIGDFNIADDHFSVKALEVIPLYKRTEYAYTLPGDLQRLYIFDAWSKVIDGQGLDVIQTKRAKKYAAETINAFTGKGDVKRILASNGAFAKLLNLTFFSPQLLISRFQTLNRLTTGFATAPKGMKWQMAKKGMRFYGVVGLIALLTGMVLDPDDDDFGTIRIKVGDRDMRDTRVNILAGLDVPAQLYMRTAMGFAKSLVSNDIAYVGDAMKANMTDFVLDKRQTPRFARSKLSPGASFGYDWLDGKDFIGRPTTLWGSVTSRVAPLSWQQVYDAFLYDRYKEMVKEPRDLQYGINKAVTHEQKMTNAIVTMVASFLGMGITQYPKDDPSQALQLARQLSPAVSKKDEETLRQEGGLRNLLKAQLTEQGEEREKAKAAVQRWLQQYPALRAEMAKLQSQVKSKTGLLAYYGKDLNADQLRRVREKATDVDEIKLIDSMIKRATKQKR